MNSHGFDLGEIVDSDGAIHSSADIVIKAKKRASLLSSYDICSSDYVVIAHGGSADLFVDLLAVWSLGCCAICLNENLSSFELNNIINFVRPRIVLSREEILFSVEGVDVIGINESRNVRSNQTFDPFGTGSLDDKA